MPQLALAHSFWEKWEGLEKPVRGGVRKAMEKFQKLSVAELHADKGLHLESVGNARDPRMRTIRVTDFWRGIVLAPGSPTEDDAFLLVNVVPHDEAYGWAAKRLYSVNSATRGLEVRNVTAIEQLTPVLERTVDQDTSRLFASYSDTVLRELGVDEEILPAVRQLTGKQQLEAFATLFPEDQYEVLLFLADGYGPEEVWRDVVAVRRPVNAGPLDPTDLGTAISNSRDRILLVSGSAELKEILSRPFAAWRIFLHPSQRRTAYRPSYGGPAQITGGPGTGKTVVALHRVKHLLERMSGTLPEASGRILLTTYTNALAASLRENLALLLDGDEESLARVDVTTVNALARRVLVEDVDSVPTLMSDQEERACWERVRDRLGLDLPEGFLAQEYRHVVLAQDIRTADEYREARRRGRGSALPPRRRDAVWAAVEEFTTRLAAEGRCTHTQMCDRAGRLLAGREEAPYQHVVVDEAQDLHPAQWRVLRGAVADGPDDLFLTGDPHQRIYDSKVSLRSLGIHVTGRSSRLRVNYRSTEEILRLSAKILADATVDDLGGDGRDTLGGYRSLLHGDTPGAVPYASPQSELAGLCEQVGTWLEMGVRSREIAVCARFHSTAEKARDALATRGVRTVLVKEGPDAGDDGVRIATMHAMKGLEFRCVAVVGVTRKAVPYARAITPEEVDRVQHEADLLTERCLLFVACTRAREALHVSWSGAPSPFLDGIAAAD